MRLIRFDSLAATPWKNGGGVTRQIACHPPASGLGSFDWRISSAEVTQDGPFSPFEGIDRRLYILGGAGLELHFAGGRTERLLPAGHLDFAGEAEVHGRLIAGPVTDLNIMVRRGRQRAQFAEVTVAGEATLAPPGEVAAIFVRHGQIQLRGEAASAEARRFDTLLMETGDTRRLAVSGAAELIVIGLTALG